MYVHSHYLCCIKRNLQQSETENIPEGENKIYNNMNAKKKKKR